MRIRKKLSLVAWQLCALSALDPSTVLGAALSEVSEPDRLLEVVGYGATCTAEKGTQISYSAVVRYRGEAHHIDQRTVQLAYPLSVTAATYSTPEDALSNAQAHLQEMARGVAWANSAAEVGNLGLILGIRFVSLGPPSLQRCEVFLYHAE